MYEIKHKQILAEGIYKVDVSAKDVANRFKCGHGIVFMPDEYSKRIITTAVYAKKDTLSITYRENDTTLKSLSELKIGDSLKAILGPIGNAIEPAKKNPFFVYPKISVLPVLLL